MKRPQFFRRLIHYVLISASLVIPVGARGASTLVTQLVNPGLLTITSLPTASLSAITLTGVTQAGTGSLGLVTVADARGSGAGWSATATTSNFSRVGNPVRITGVVGALVVGGTYDHAASGTYTVTVTTGGILGTARYSVSGLETQASTLAGVGTPLGTRGLTVTLAAATYTVGDQWTVEVDTIPASNLTITPSAVTTVLGVGTGVTAGSAHTFVDSNDAATIMAAPASAGLGVYTNLPNLSLNLPPGTRSGAYVATITETIN